MSNFKVGDKVLCVKTNISEAGVSVVAGKEYIIHDVLKCGCGQVALNIGMTLYRPFIVECLCKVDIEPSGIWWQGDFRFVKADEQDNFASEVLEEIAEKIEVEFIELHNTGNE